MATLRTSPGPNGQYLATPDQASRIFNPNGLAPVRQKHLFLVRFLRRAFGANEEWRDGLSFVAKSIDRPSVKPVLEELNQYNKKRQIQTGIKYDPVNLTVYDTTDNNGGSGAAMKLWLEYAAYHFGDYNHIENLADFGDDIVDLEMRRSNGFGFGMHLPTQNAITIAGEGSQFFFDGLEVYQVHANKYVKYTLVNPRISSFTPDDLDYANSEASTIQMQISYEGIVHHANGQAQPLDASMVSIFGNLLQSQGMAFNLPNEVPNTASTTTQGILPGAFDAAAQFMQRLGVVQPNLPTNIPPALTQGGVLERFGNFDFGNTASLPNGLPSEVSFASDLINGAVGNRNVSQMNAAMIRGVHGAAQEMGISPLDVAQHDDGVTINSSALAITNQSMDGTYQIGFRRQV